MAEQRYCACPCHRPLPPEMHSRALYLSADCRAWGMRQSAARHAKRQPPALTADTEVDHAIEVVRARLKSTHAPIPTKAGLRACVSSLVRADGANDEEWRRAAIIELGAWALAWLIRRDLPRSSPATSTPASEEQLNGSKRPDGAY